MPPKGQPLQRPVYLHLYAWLAAERGKEETKMIANIAIRH